MLGDIIRKGRDLESQRIRAWKARCRVETARRSVIDQLLLPQPEGDMAQMAFEMEQETAQRQLEEAEFEYLRAREGAGDNSLTRVRAQGRAASFAVWALLKLQQYTPEPMHPILDVPMRWIFGEDDDIWDEIDYPIDGSDWPASSR